MPFTKNCFQSFGYNLELSQALSHKLGLDMSYTYISKAKKFHGNSICTKHYSRATGIRNTSVERAALKYDQYGLSLIQSKVDFIPSGFFL